MILTFLIFAFAASLEAQVTIGLEEAPMEGALLQLKNISVSGQQPNANKGLLLPRVELTATDAVSGSDSQKLLASLKLVLPSGTNIDAEKHAGLTVYNTSTLGVPTGAPFEENKVCPGVYVWNGQKWTRVMATECQ